MQVAEPTTAKCRRCHRTLTSAASVARGAGRWCRAREIAAQTAELLKGFTAAQVEKARDLLAEGALLPTRHAGVFEVLSSDGSRTYRSHSATCTCPWGLRGKAKACAHSLAVRIVLVSGKVA